MDKICKLKDTFVKKDTLLSAMKKGFFLWGSPEYYVHCDTENIIEDSEILPVPTQSILQGWIRDIHHIHISIYLDGYLKYYVYWTNTDYLNTLLTQAGPYDTYEQALEIGLQQSLKLIKDYKYEL